VARKMGAEVTAFGEEQKEAESFFGGVKKGLFVQRLGKLSGVELLMTECYPGFPTDLQSPALAALSVAEGESLICESIFENRFRVAEPLNRMGARISLPDATHAMVEGVDRLQGKLVEAVELRGGASLILAGLFAEGRTLVCGGQYIERGYENICRDLRELGARIGSA
jgi:UDP-N-acetylglucosamine 1-carboxyvinyltransferase (fragment)